MARTGLRRVVLVGITLGLVATVLLGVSLVGAWMTPGNEDFSAKWADWLRGHHASAMVNPIEQWYYSTNAPSKGGRPKSLNPVPVAHAARAVGSTTIPAGPRHLPTPSAIPLLVQPSLAGEGVWRPTGPLVDGAPHMFVAQFRADPVYTSQITSAVWIDPTAFTLALIPGAREPGGIWPQPPNLGGPLLARAVAAFNGGFRFQDARGGFYLNGRTAVPLQLGAASIVFYQDGSANVGLWGRDVTMTPQGGRRAPEPRPAGGQGPARPECQLRRHQVVGPHPGRQHGGGPLRGRDHRHRRAGVRGRARR